MRTVKTTAAHDSASTSRFTRRFSAGVVTRGGFTLVEMLVAVTLLVLMMTIVAAIFGSATSAMLGLRVHQELDGYLQQIDATIRQDLLGVTATMMPPLDPDDGDGYFEYGENQFADLQGEDSDDYIRFTAKAPEGHLFSGRVWIGSSLFLPSPPFPVNTPRQPVIIHSQYAEIIYFLRNGNLYRRVLLIVPERQLTIGQGFVNTNATPPIYGNYSSAEFGGINVGWMAMNDVSARPQYNPLVSSTTGFPYVPKLNTLGDLTNRHNRAFYPRFTDDYFTITSNGFALAPDGIADDLNADSVPDLYPTLYRDVFGTGLLNPSIDPFVTGTPTAPHTLDTLAFPYVFPGAYSVPDFAPGSAHGQIGAIHGMSPNGAPLINGVVPPSPPYVLPNPAPYGFFYANGVSLASSGSGPAGAVPRPNHSPLESGDTLAPPAGLQTWWGFPTWRETASPLWTDPVYAINDPSPNPNQQRSFLQAAGLSWTNYLNNIGTIPTTAGGYLPPLNDPSLDAQPFNDGFPHAGALTAGNPFVMPIAVYRDDLILQGVRSFDVKAYDDSVPGYVDLGYSNYLYGVTPQDAIPAPFVNANLTHAQSDALFAQALLTTMGHEGRIPPLLEDFRVDPNSGLNIGDNQTTLLRLRRVWDTWSTDYSNAPQTGINARGFPIGPPFSQPVYPSYPPPYPAPLRGIQIQIRVTDPRNERIKTLTIRQDFSDKLQ
jgi:prepilin-type N-terminal cleavage/methylation domain-containing protein